MTTVRCEECGKSIPKERLEALPNTIHCVGCSTEKPRTENDLDLDGASLAERSSAITGNERTGGNAMDRAARKI